MDLLNEFGDDDQDKNSQKYKEVYAKALLGTADLYIDGNVFTRLLPILEEIKKISEDFPREHQISVHNIDLMAKLNLIVGKYKEAQDLFEVVLDVTKTTIGPNHPYVCAVLVNISKTFWLRGDFAQALKVAEESEGIALKSFNQEHPVVATSHFAKARALHSLARYSEAANLMQTCLDVRRSKLGQRHALVGSTLCALAEIKMDMGFPSEANVDFREAFAIRHENYGVSGASSEYHQELADSLLGLALNAQERGYFRESLNFYSKALKMATEMANALNITDDVYVAAAMLGKSRAKRRLGDNEDSQAMLSKAGMMTCALHGETSPQAALCLFALGEIAAEKGAFKEAKKLFARCAVIQKKALGDNHPVVWRTNIAIADISLSLGKYDKATKLSDDCLNMLRLFLVDGHPLLATCEFVRGRALAAMARFEEAESSLETSFEWRRDRLGGRSAKVAQSICALVELKLAQGLPSACNSFMTEAEDTLTKRLGEMSETRHKDLAKLLSLRAEIAVALGQYKSAADLYKQVIEMLEHIVSSLGQSDDADLCVALLGAGNCARLLGKHSEAQTKLTRAAEMAVRVMGEASLLASHCDFALGELARDRGEMKDSKLLLTKALTVRGQELTMEHPMVADTMHSLSETYRQLGYYEEAFVPLRTAHVNLLKTFGARNTRMAAVLR